MKMTDYFFVLGCKSVHRSFVVLGGFYFDFD